MELQNIGAFVDTFLDGEKEGARLLIRHELESMIDPLVESLFGQLKVKLLDYVGVSKYKLVHVCDDDEQMIRDRETIFNAQQYHSQSLGNANHSMDANSQLYSSSHQNALISIKQEINDPANVQLEPEQNDHSINSSSSAHESFLFPQTMIPSTSSGESLSNTDTIQLQNQQQFFNIKHDQFDEEDCECEKCVYGGMEVKEEDDDSDDDQEDGESSRSLKKQKMDSTQLNNTQPEVVRQSTRQSTGEAQTNEYDRPEDESDQMGSVGSQESDTQSTIEHYDHGQDNDESMAIQQNQNDTNNAIANPIQPNNTQSNRLFQCPHCSRTFNRKSNLQEHVRVHTGEQPFACGQCGKRFSQTSGLAQHQLFHQNIKPFHCDQCDKQFVLKIQLDSHLRTHSGERPYKCRFCEMSFAESGSRNTHEQAKHLHVKPYRCKVCGHTATKQVNIIKHIRVIHFGLPATLKQQRERNIIDHREPRDLVEKVLVL